MRKALSVERDRGQDMPPADTLSIGRIWLGSFVVIPEEVERQITAQGSRAHCLTDFGVSIDSPAQSD
jgi:hypothetical protein